MSEKLKLTLRVCSPAAVEVTVKDEVGGRREEAAIQTDRAVWDRVTLPERLAHAAKTSRVAGKLILNLGELKPEDTELEVTCREVTQTCWSRI